MEDVVALRKLREREAEGAAGGAEGENNAGEGNSKGKEKLVAGRTRSKQGSSTLTAPLRQAAGPEAPIMVKVPFANGDLHNWKVAARNYRDNPERAAKVFNTMIWTQDPDWNDIEAIMGELFDSTERDMIQRTSWKRGKTDCCRDTARGSKCPLPFRRPPNTGAGRSSIMPYQKLVLYGIRNAIPEAINWSNLYEIKQDRKESPTDFLKRFKEAARKYTEEGKLQLVTLFMRQSDDDIRHKLQNLEGDDSRNLSKMLDVAWVVYRNRGQQKEKQEARLGENQCVLCKQEGQWKRECSLAKKMGNQNQNLVFIAELDE